MNLEIRQQAATPGAPGEHGRTPIAFVVDRILEVTLARPAMPTVCADQQPPAGRNIEACSCC
jgi:hypothetical protein